MRTLFNLLFLFCTVSTQAQTADPRIERTVQLIERVNSTWQQTHDPRVRAFWDEAAYHTGNVETYLLLSKIPRREQTAQTFQTYIDLYRIDEDSAIVARRQIYEQAAKDGIMVDLPMPRHYRFVERAHEVMGYEAASTAHDYWWWADALYMVMPVMTKMYKLTYSDRYLDKLYENLLYTDSIMLDAETGLYFRDGKYVYPKHTTATGKKDFWARGDGWVLAGLAKVLQDLPHSWRHYEFFKQKY